MIIVSSFVDIVQLVAILTVQGSSNYIVPNF